MCRPFMKLKGRLQSDSLDASSTSKGPTGTLTLSMAGGAQKEEQKRSPRSYLMRYTGGVPPLNTRITRPRAMEHPDIFYDGSEYIETASGNKVSRTCVLCGSRNIVLNGKCIVQSDCIIRGDLANINIGRLCVVGKRSVITPPFKKLLGGGAFYPLQIGDNVFVGEDTVINAGQVGSYVHIGSNCVIGQSCVLKDCCRIEDNTVLPADTVVPSFAIFAGSPGTIVGELPESMQDLMSEATRSFYQHFKKS